MSTPGSAKPSRGPQGPGGVRWVEADALMRMPLSERNEAEP